MNSEIGVTNDRSLSVRVLKRLLGGFSLEAEFSAPHGVTILFGPSGSGKTTLLNCIAGLVAPDEGRIALGSRVLFDSSRKFELPVPERAIGYLVQDLALFPHLTVEQNVQYGLAKLSTPIRRERIENILDSFRISHLLKRKPSQISGGERQRVALARSLVTNPGVLLLDEPLSALDADVKSKIMEDLRVWNAAHGIPIVYVTHSADEAFALGERVVVLDSGKVLAQGTPQFVLDTPRHETVARLAGFENVFDAIVVSLNEPHGTMLCRLKASDIQIEVPLTRAKPGSLVRLAIRAGDIMLATSRPHGLSARNVFQGTLRSLQQQGAIVIAAVESGVTFEVHLTPSAREELQLEVGQQTWLVIKTYSCHPMDRRN